MLEKNKMQEIFDNSKKKRDSERFTPIYDDFFVSFLDRVFEFLGEINNVSVLPFENPLVLNDKNSLVKRYLGQFNPRTFEECGVNEEEFLKDNIACNPSAVVSFFNLHKVNKIGQFMRTTHEILPQNGLFCGSFYGTSNILELKNACMQADLAVYNGVYPRVLPFIEIKTIGMLMQNLGFKNISSVSYTFSRQFKDVWEACEWIKNKGEGNCLKNRKIGLTSKKFFFNLDRVFMDNFGGRLSFEIIFFMGFK
jgi:hypothetical protein